MIAPVLLVARRDYFAYVGSLGFWIGLLTAPLIMAVVLFAPVLLARAEPPRLLTVLAERAVDGQTVRAAFAEQARGEARAVVRAFIAATAPPLEEEALAAFDAAATRAEAVSAARAVVARRAPSALAAFPNALPRYILVTPPADTIAGVKPYLSGERRLEGGGVLYGALNLRRDETGAPVIEYWSVNLNHSDPSDIAQRAMRLEMQREALAAQGLAPAEADRLQDLAPQVAAYDPRPSAGGGEVTLRQRAPFFAALALSFVLWSVVFSVANMLLTGVIEEKSNKILDTLLTSVTPLEMLIGKLLGVAAVSATLFLFWGALGGFLLSTAVTQLGASVFGQIAAAFLEPRLIAAFLIGFVAGYLMYGAIFLALGSLCDSLQEAQTLLGPVAMVLAIPMLLITPAIDNPNAPLVEMASWVPLFTPFLLLIRAPTGLAWTEIAGQGALVLVSVFVILLLAARVFRAGVVDQVSLASWRGRKGKG